MAAGRAIVVDSSVWIGYFEGGETRETALLDGILGVGPVMTGDPILAEILGGFRDEGDARRARAALDTLIFEAMAGRAVALAAARNCRILRAGGAIVPGAVDMLTATFCMENGHRPRAYPTWVEPRRRGVPRYGAARLLRVRVFLSSSRVGARRRIEGRPHPLPRACPGAQACPGRRSGESRARTVPVALGPGTSPG